MAQRTVALWNGKLIGIENIYTVINGKQINIPEKLNELRIKSQNKELFCPCGCGSNLILVAGDKNLREQHFRIKDSDSDNECSMVTEGRTSVESKIVLKCWLDDKLHLSDLESRVPIRDVTDGQRKYEFTFLSRAKGIAVNYCHDRVNLSDEKLEILETNGTGISIIHVVDSMNGGCDGQYPEGLMKIQDRQGYCFLLTVSGMDYNEARLSTVFYEKDLDGLWQEITVSNDFLKYYLINDDGYVCYNKERITDIVQVARKHFREINEEIRLQRVKEAERREALRIQAEKEREVLRKKREEEEAKRQAYLVEQKRIDEEKRVEDEKIRQDMIRREVEQRVQQQEEQAIVDGVRWCKCEFCGKIARLNEFSTYGGIHHINLGTCKECDKNNPEVKKRLEEKLSNLRSDRSYKQKYDPTICPECGGRMIEKNGRNGRFYGCSNYHLGCRFTRSIR